MPGMVPVLVCAAATQERVDRWGGQARPAAWRRMFVQMLFLTCGH